MEVKSTNFNGSKSTSMEYSLLPRKQPCKAASFSSFIYFHESLHLLSSTSVEASTNVHGSWKYARFHASNSSFHGGSSSIGLGLVFWKQLEVCDTRGSRWKYVGVYGRSWELPRNIFVEAAIDGSNGSFYFHRQWKLPCFSMEDSTNFH